MSITLHQRFLYRGYLQIACCDLSRSNNPCLWLLTWDPSQPVATRPLAVRKDGTWYVYGWDLTKNICEVYGPAGYIRTAYTYTPYGAVTAAGDVTQPIQWSSEYNDTESGLIYYNYRHYNPVDGRWTGRDRLSFATDGNPYCFIFNKSHAIDILGLYLYAIEGTSYDLAGDSNVARMYHLYKYIADFPFNLFGETAHYIPGTQSAVRGSDCVDISERLLTRICEDFCNNHKAGRTVPIDIVGWSRGAAIAIDVTIQLSIRGCQCCDEIHHPKVNWLGLFDPVDMTLPFSGRELQTGHIPDIVKSGTIIYATDRTLTYSGGLLDFIPVMPQDEFSRMTSVYLPTATHNDIGGEGNHDRNRNATSLLIMIQSLMSSYTK